MSTQSQTMQALIFEGPGRMSLQDVPKPAAGPGEILIQIEYAAICGTDVRIASGRKTRDVRQGHPIGHECAGRIAEIGEGVSGYDIGQRVALCVVVSCGQCEYCDANHENLCETRITLGYHTDGAFAEYMLIPAHAVARGNVFHLPAEIEMDVAPLLEPMACCINGQAEMELIPPPYVAAEPPPRTLVIFGAGPIGLTHLKLARARGIEAVTVVEPTASRREIARQFGAVETCSPEEFQANGRFEAAICAVGVAELVDLAMKSVTKRGKVNLFAGFDKTAVSTIDPNIIHYQQLRITGASESRRRDYAEAIDLVLTGSIDPAPLITHRFRLDAYKEAFELAESGSALKILFEMSGPGD